MPEQHHNKPIKILHIITQLDCGGSARSTLLTACGLHDDRCQSAIACGVSVNPSEAAEAAAHAAGVPIFHFPNLRRPMTPWRDVLALVNLYRLIHKNKYDIVHTHTSKAGILGRFAAKMAGTPVIIHTPHGHVFYGYFSKALTAFYVFLEWAVMGFTDALITLTRREKQDYLDRHIGPAAKIYPIYSGIPLEPFLTGKKPRAQVRAQLGISETEFVCGTVARLVAIKNHALIVEAAGLLVNHIKNIRFVFVGDGELHDQLTEQINNAGLSEHFLFLGWRSDVADLVRAFDIFVLCSKNEGMGRAFVEAQAAGVPVIGSRICGIPEVLLEGRTGLLIDHDRAHELAEKIMLLYNNPERTTIMPQQCREWVNPRFSVETMVAEIERLYQKSLGSLS
ncbi:MAG: glycosyltransferase family 4 protein [Chitinivibrionales bacterium]|nr:glycosyltransferase family 4 protein [Chitinivibrionales bacterium]